METFFKKYFWLFEVAIVVVAALLVALGVSRLVGAGVAKYTIAVPEGAPEPPTAVASGTDAPPRIATGVFPVPEPEIPVDPCAEVTCEEGQRCNSLTGECEIVEDEAAAEEVGDGTPCPASDIAMNLVGTMVSDHPDWSIAILHNPSTDKTEFVRTGAQILAQADVTRIERNRVFLNRNGNTECLRPGGADAATAAATRARPAARAAARRPARPQPVAQSAAPAAAAPAQQTIQQRIRTGVRRTGAGEYSINRETLTEVLRDPAAMRDQQPQVSPFFEDSQAAGYRLDGIRSGSMFSAIGIRNGDVIRAVNGQTVDSPARAMQLYESLLTQGRVELEVQRQGRRQTLTYNIQ